MSKTSQLHFIRKFVHRKKKLLTIRVYLVPSFRKDAGTSQAPVPFYSTGPTYKVWVEDDVKQWVKTGQNVNRHINFAQISPLIL